MVVDLVDLFYVFCVLLIGLCVLIWVECYSYDVVVLGGYLVSVSGVYLQIVLCGGQWLFGVFVLVGDGVMDDCLKFVIVNVIGGEMYLFVLVVCYVVLVFIVLIVVVNVDVCVLWVGLIDSGWIIFVMQCIMNFGGKVNWILDCVFVGCVVQVFVGNFGLGDGGMLIFLILVSFLVYLVVNVSYLVEVGFQG